MENDESSTDNEERYFGWANPSQTEPDSEKFDMAIRAEPFPAELLVEFEATVGVIPKIRPTLIDYLVLRSEFEELLKLPDHVRSIFETTRFPLFEVGVRNIDSHVLVERRLSSFLNSASAFRDRLLVRVSDDEQSDSTIRAKTSEIYDRLFGYRLCYNLRNFSQHRSNPIHIIPVNASRNAAGTLEYRIDLELDRDRLLDSESKFQPKVKSELGKMSEKIPLIHNCEEYYRGLQEIFGAYLSLSGPDLHNLIGYEEAVRRTVREMPAGATPLIFHGKPKQMDGELKDTKVTSFSFDELKLLKVIMKEMAVPQ